MSNSSIKKIKKHKEAKAHFFTEIKLKQANL
jgi:hypothetical protein